MTEEQADRIINLLEQLSEDNDTQTSLLEDIKIKLSDIEGNTNDNYDLGDVVNAVKEVEAAVIHLS